MANREGMNQLTIDTSNKYPQECRYCVHWQLMPLNQQKEGWGVNGYCNSPRCMSDTLPYWTRCEDHTPVEEKPSWENEVWKLKNTGFAGFIKEQLLDVKIDTREKKIYNKHGIIIKSF